MSGIIIVQPLPLATVTASRGTGADNLRSPDPKEVWADAAVGSAATLTIDLGAVAYVDTILLGYVRPPTAGATWALNGGIIGANDIVLQASAPLRVPDVAGSTPDLSHALCRINPVQLRYVTINLTQPAGATALTAGVIVIGRAFQAELGQEWGAGREPIDLGTATELPSGGFAVVEGARKRGFSWTFGDLSADEADQLELLAGALGETKPGLVIEDPALTTGLRARIHYGLFKKWAAYERRNRRQTRWEIGIRQWV